MGIAFMCVITAKRAPLCAGGEKCSEPSSCGANCPLEMLQVPTGRLWAALLGTEGAARCWGFGLLSSLSR